MTGRDIDRHVGSTAGVRLPWPAPRRDSRLERGDNLVGEFLVVVASLCGMASQVSHGLLLGTELFLKTASPPSHGPPAGQGRASGPGETSEAARPAEPLRRRASMRDRSLSVYLYGACIDLYSSSSTNKRSALRATWKARKSPFARARAEDEQRQTARRGWTNPDGHRQKSPPEAAWSLGRKRPRRAHTAACEPAPQQDYAAMQQLQAGFCWYHSQLGEAYRASGQLCRRRQSTASIRKVGASLRPTLDHAPAPVPRRSQRARRLNPCAVLN